MSVKLSQGLQHKHGSNPAQSPTVALPSLQPSQAWHMGSGLVGPSLCSCSALVLVSYMEQSCLTPPRVTNSGESPKAKQRECSAGTPPARQAEGLSLSLLHLNAGPPLLQEPLFVCCEPGAMLSWQRLLERRVLLDVIKTTAVQSCCGLTESWAQSNYLRKSEG